MTIKIKKLAKDDKGKQITFAVVNHKGGCGKTTTCENLMEYIFKNKGSLMGMDNDTQGNASEHLGVYYNDDPEEEGFQNNSMMRIYDNFNKKNPIERSVYVPLCIDENKENGNKMFLIVGCKDSEDRLYSLVKNNTNDQIISNYTKLIKFYRNYISYVVIDTAPAMENENSNAFIVGCSDAIVIPFETYETLNGINNILDQLVKNREVKNPNIIFNMVKYSARSINNFDQYISELLLDLVNFYEFTDIECLVLKNPELASKYGYNTSNGKNLNYVHFMMKKIFGESPVCSNVINEKSIFKHTVRKALKKNSVHEREADAQSEEIFNKAMNNDGIFVLEEWRNNTNNIRDKFMVFTQIVDFAKRGGVTAKIIDYEFEDVEECLKNL